MANGRIPYTKASPVKITTVDGKVREEAAFDPFAYSRLVSKGKLSSNPRSKREKQLAQARVNEVAPRPR